MIVNYSHKLFQINITYCNSNITIFWNLELLLFIQPQYSLLGCIYMDTEIFIFLFSIRNNK